MTDEIERAARYDAAESWCEKYSSFGDFEEFGQQEAFHAGWKAGASFAEQRMNERVAKLVEALEEKLVSITKVNFAGPSTDERREWTWATATQALTDLEKK